MRIPYCQFDYHIDRFEYEQFHAFSRISFKYVRRESEAKERLQLVGSFKIYLSIHPTE